MIDLSKKREELKKQSGSSLSKTLLPGEHTCTINKISYKDGYNPDSLVIQLELEGPDLSEHGFVGFARDKDNPAMGNYSGQVGKVGLSQWDFESKVISGKNGDFEVDRDSSIINELSKLSQACGKQDELMEGLVNDVYEFVNKADKVLSGSVLTFVIAGREWINNQGYSQYNLFLPRATKNQVAYGNADDNNLMKFDKDKMIISKVKAPLVDEFKTDDDFPF